MIMSGNTDRHTKCARPIFASLHATRPRSQPSVPLVSILFVQTAVPFTNVIQAANHRYLVDMLELLVAYL